MSRCLQLVHLRAHRHRHPDTHTRRRVFSGEERCCSTTAQQPRLVAERETDRHAIESIETMSRNVFVGNIPYDLTEEQLIDIFRQCGPVRGFRLVFDRDTNRPKGFGFCEYNDASSAASALRNLDGYEVGGRALRVSGSGGEGDRSSATPQPTAQQGGGLVGVGMQAGVVPPPNVLLPQQQQQVFATPPPQPAVVQQQPQVAPQADSPQDAISKTLATLPPAQLLEVVTQLRQLAIGDSAKLETLLRTSPQLTYAVLQALLLLNLVDVGVVQRVVRGESIENTPTTAPPAAAAASVSQETRDVRRSETPAAAAQGYTTGDPSKDALIKQIMALGQTQIDALPPDQRNQVLAIKSRILAGTF